jgi:hypothetical protein
MRALCHVATIGWSNIMKRTLIALTAAAAVGAGTVGVPTSANAYPAWVIPAIVAAGVGGVIVGGATIASSRAQAQAYYEPRGTVYVRPSGEPRSCSWARERLADGSLRRIRVCN